MVKVNGEIVENAVDLSLEDYLKQENYTISRVAVELNGNIVPKADYAKTMIAKGDKLEVVSFVGGGWYYEKWSKKAFKRRIRRGNG